MLDRRLRCSILLFDRRISMLKKKDIPNDNRVLVYVTAKDFKHGYCLQVTKDNLSVLAKLTAQEEPFADTSCSH